MPNSKINRRVQEPAEKNRKGKVLCEKASSFHGRIPTAVPAKELRRPKTLPNLWTEQAVQAGGYSDSMPKLTKLLLNVTIQGSVGAIQVVMPPENTVGDLIDAALRKYSKEGRRQTLPISERSRFDLHYSQFSLESLHRVEKLIELGLRNFFVCPKKAVVDGGEGTASCSKEVEKISKTGSPWLKFMDFLF